MLVQKYVDLGEPNVNAIFHFFFNPDHGHTRSESTQETVQERMEVLVPNQLFLFRAIDWARGHKFEHGTATVIFVNYSQKFLDIYRVT